MRAVASEDTNSVVVEKKSQYKHVCGELDGHLNSKNRRRELDSHAVATTMPAQDPRHVGILSQEMIDSMVHVRTEENVQHTKEDP